MLDLSPNVFHDAKFSLVAEIIIMYIFIIAGFFLQVLVRVLLAEICKSRGASVCRKPRKGASSRMK